MYFLAPIGFVNGQYESRFYVNSPFQVQFLNIYFIQLILNNYSEKKIEQLADSEDEFASKLQNIMMS